MEWNQPRVLLDPDCGGKDIQIIETGQCKATGLLLQTRLQFKLRTSTGGIISAKNGKHIAFEDLD